MVISSECQKFSLKDNWGWKGLFLTVDGWQLKVNYHTKPLIFQLNYKK